MKYRSRLTSKGTTTIPVAIRKQLRLKPGMYVTFALDRQTGEYSIQRSRTIEEVRTMNQELLKKLGTWDKPYKSGDGFTAHVLEKYGKPQ